MSLKFEPHFLCTRCGACCRSVSLSSLTAWLDRGNGICRHLDDETALCSIYENRPDVCRVDLQYKINYQRVISWQKFCELNQQCCAMLQKSANFTNQIEG
jgi:Fe-S-cluster containining protein